MKEKPNSRIPRGAKRKALLSVAVGVRDAVRVLCFLAQECGAWAEIDPPVDKTKRAKMKLCLEN